MSAEHQEFSLQYAKMDELELMGVARAYDSLTDEAQSAIRLEFSTRGLEPPLIEESDQVAPRSLSTIRRYRDLSEAIVARSLLESAGIPAYLRDENLVRLDWQISNFIGGIRLQVDTADEQSAFELLNQPVPSTIDMNAGGEFVQPRCPNCGAADITFNGASRGAALASLYLLSLPMPPGPETWTCNVCGAHWEDTEG